MDIRKIVIVVVLIAIGYVAGRKFPQLGNMVGLA